MKSPLDKAQRGAAGVLYRNHLSPRAIRCRWLNDRYSHVYIDLSAAVLCRDFAAHRCYEETI